MTEGTADLPNHCAVGDCFQPPEAQARLELMPAADSEPVVLGVPLCGEHRDLLRYGVDSCTIDT